MHELLENIVLISLFVVLLGARHKLAIYWKEAREDLPANQFLAAGLEFYSVSTHKIPLRAWLFGYHAQYITIAMLKHRHEAKPSYKMTLFCQYVEMYVRIMLAVLFYVTLLFWLG